GLLISGSGSTKILCFWSVTGLYSAFVAEVVTRAPGLQSLSVVFVAALSVMAIANFLCLRLQDTLEENRRGVRWNKMRLL
ncbi:MAG: hypothetical protein OEM82_15930, partial [Acidobacteriota bacterium]|nr:hypothetical protein [Acidobacteriota bacterium]